MQSSKKFQRAVDPRKFLSGTRRHTTLPPEKALDVLKQLESRAVKIDARGKNNLPPPQLTAMEKRALNDAIRLALVRVGMLKRDKTA